MLYSFNLDRIATESKRQPRDNVLTTFLLLSGISNQTREATEAVAAGTVKDQEDMTQDSRDEMTASMAVLIRTVMVEAADAPRMDWTTNS
jgi:hypothetical protein